MSRSISEIQSSITNQIRANTNLSGLSSQSQTAIWNLWTYIIATAMNEQEVLMDDFTTNAETLILSNSPANINWITKMVYAFQYNASSPQVVQLNTTTFVPYYATTNASYNIITRCAVISPYISNGSVVGTTGVVLIKVAKGSTPTALSAGELSAFQSYLNIIKPAGLIYKALSLSGDKLFCKVKIWYDGAYTGSIKNDVYTAYLNYLTTLPFNGIMKVSDLEGVLRNVTGVTDAQITDLGYRVDSATFTPGSYNMVNSSLQIRNDSTGIGSAGYVVDETTGGYNFLTINDSNYYTN